jgi:hypothetical protein
MNKTNQNKYEIYTVSLYEGNAYIMETVDGYYDALWTAPLLKDESVDNSQWTIVTDEIVINNVLDSNERLIIDEMPVDEFNKKLFGEQYE